MKAVWKGLIIVHEGTKRLAHNYLYVAVDSMGMAHNYLEVPEGSRLANNYLEVPEGTRRLAHDYLEVPEGSRRLGHNSLEVPECSTGIAIGTLEVTHIILLLICRLVLNHPWVDIKHSCMAVIRHTYGKLDLTRLQPVILYCL